MIRRCPSIEELEVLVELDDKKLIKHATKCVGCQAVLALLADRTAEIETPGCAETEVLAAMSANAELGDDDEAKLREHISTCEACRLLWSGELP